ncbi:MAG: helix-turn-helix domain-containing protein [Qingshengfaniella sp.]
MSDSKFDEIRTLDLFAQMDDDAFDNLMRGAYLQTFPPQIDLITQGDPADFLHVILAGAVELFATWNGRETVMATVRPVSTFILAATVKNGPNLMSARTLEKCRIILIPSEDVRAAFHASPAFAEAIVMDLAQCYRSSIRTTKNLKLRNSSERLAGYLLRQQDKARGDPCFALQVEKRRLASYLGMTAENLSRAFNGLKAHGVAVDGGQITIRNRAKLEKLAQPDPLVDDYSL